jgi:quinol monooxygenase YgiN
MANEKVIMLIEAKLQPQRRAELAEAIRQYLPLVRAEPGVEAFYITAQKDDPNTFVFYEVYRSQAAQDFHLEQDFTKKFLATLKECAGRRQSADKSCRAGPRNVEFQPATLNGILADISSWLRRWPAVADTSGTGMLGRTFWLVTSRRNQARFHQPSVHVDSLHVAGSRGTDRRQVAEYAGTYGASRPDRAYFYGRGVWPGTCHKCRYKPLFFSAAGRDRCSPRGLCRL